MPMPTGMSIEQEILQKITPSAEENKRISRAVDDLILLVQNASRTYPYGLEALLVGSVAKGTYLKDPDIDIFIMFPPSVDRERLEEVGLSIGEKVIKGEKRYAEHPYIHGEYKGYEVDIVPCYKVADPSNLKSAVDRTPFHTEFVMKSLKEGHRKEVRLLKQFMKGIGTYGADSGVQGFSGYLVELLIIRYGSFRAALEAASSWRINETISIRPERKKEFKDPLIFYDPVDPKRNVSSALSVDSFARFIHASKSYLAEERQEFFFPRSRTPLTMAALRAIVKKKGTDVLVIRLDRPDINIENLYPQMRKTLEGTADLLREEDFKVLDKADYLGKYVYLILELEAGSLSSAKKHTGPPVWIPNSDDFIKKWRNSEFGPPFIENGRWMVFAPRRWASVHELIKKNMKCAALGSDLRRLKGLKVFGLEEMGSAEFRAPLSALLDKRDPWKV